MKVSLASSNVAPPVPMNQGPLYDGTRYWMFYATVNGAKGDLRCLYGTSLDNLTATNTDGTSGNIGFIDNGGKARSIVLGFESGVPYAYVAMARSVAGTGYLWHRYQLTSSGLGTPTKFFSMGITSETTVQSQLTPNPSTTMAYTKLYGVRTVITPGSSSNRDMTISTWTDAGMGGFTYAANYLENRPTYQLSDGYLALGINGGDFGDSDYESNGSASEWVKTLSGDSWPAENDITGTGPGSFEDQAYSDDTSHTGGRISRQFADGTIVAIYIDDFDTVAGNYGNLILRTRGNTKASTWTTRSLDLAEEKVWTIGMTLNAAADKIVVQYVPDNSGNFGSVVKQLIYDPTTNEVTYQGIVHTAETGRQIERIDLPWRIVDSTVPMIVQDSSNELWATQTSTILISTPRIEYVTSFKTQNSLDRITIMNPIGSGTTVELVSSNNPAIVSGIRSNLDIENLDW